MKRSYAAILISLLSLAGCTSKPRSLQHEWSKTMRQIGVIPVFPPREDVQVGDVFVMGVHPDSREVALAMETDPSRLTDRQRTIRSRLGMSTRWEMLPVARSVSLEYSNRPSWPKTPAEYEAILDSEGQSLWTQPTTTAEDRVGPYWLDIYDTYHTYGDRLNRLRLVAFPEFSATTFQAAEIAGLVPVEAWSSGFAAEASDIGSITISIPAAETYALSVRPLLDSLTRKLDEDEKSRRVGLMLRSRIEKGVASFVGGYQSTQRPSRQAVNLLVYILENKQSEDQADTYLGTIPSEPMPQLSEAEAMEQAFEMMTQDKLQQRRPLNNSDRRFVEAGIASLSSIFDEKRGATLSIQAAPLGIASEYLRHLDVVGQEGGDANVYIVVVTEVFYARAMDISVIRRRGGKAEAAMNPPTHPPTQPTNRLEPARSVARD